MYEFINNNNITLDYIDMLKQQVIVEYGVKIGNKFNDILYKNLMYLYANSNQKAKESKAQIRKELEYVGINQASLFPEVDKVADYLRKMA